MDTTKRGVSRWKEAQRRGEDRVNLQISLLSLECLPIYGLCHWPDGYSDLDKATIAVLVYHQVDTTKGLI